MDWTAKIEAAQRAEQIMEWAPLAFAATAFVVTFVALTVFARRDIARK